MTNEKPPYWEKSLIVQKLALAYQHLYQDGDSLEVTKKKYRATKRKEFLTLQTFIEERIESQLNRIEELEAELMEILTKESKSD